MEEKNPIQVADRLFGALEYLADNGASSLTETAAALELNKSTMHRIFSSLICLGYVRQNEVNGLYEMTFKVADLTERMMNHVDVINIVHPYLQRLMEKCNETVHFVRREETECVYIDKVEATSNNIRMVSRIGSRIPFYRSSGGKALAANMSPSEVKALWDSCDIQRKTAYTITNYDNLCDALEEIRRKGYALDNEENETGVRCIGIALDIAGRSVDYAISISVPISRMDNDRIEELSKYILETKKEIDTTI
ncbi:MAG: IclR family transcriptional regulator [Clostridiales bacterium]|nr:IclR family transcriptional regulator [Clostridiales bacterium]